MGISYVEGGLDGLCNHPYTYKIKELALSVFATSDERNETYCHKSIMLIRAIETI